MALAGPIVRLMGARAVAQWSGALGFIDLLLLSRRTGLGNVLSLPRPRDLLPLLRVGGSR